jgi:hypothetical protein
MGSAPSYQRNRFLLSIDIDDVISVYKMGCFSKNEVFCEYLANGLAKPNNFLHVYYPLNASFFHAQASRICLSILEKI